MDNSIEIWKDIEGYEGMYQVSNMGRVRSLDRVKPNSGGQIAKGHILPHSDNRHGYRFVSLWKFNKGRRFYVHRLVASAFIPNPNNFPIINHKDEDKSNNRHDNLEWCTQKYNINYGNHMKRLKESYIANGNNRPIDVYDMKGTFLKTFDCSNEVCKELGVQRRGLYLACQGVTKSYKGYRFAFHGEPLKKYEPGRGFSKVIHVFKYDSEGYLVSWYDSMRNAERDNGMGRGYLRTHNIKHNGNIVKDGFRFVLAIQ
jgi:hypothetical protein